ncbi:MAG: DNA-binding protein, partial [Thermodesulfobacteriota bacterium]|nr:DNA-binding protein [Thermodesulfobacteriota bacterium]
MKDAYTTKELAEIEGVNGVTILRFAKRESWKSRPRPGRGGGAEWIVASMPEHRRAAIAAYEAKAAEATLVSYHGDAPALLEPNTLLLSGKRREKALAKADLLSLYLKWVGKAKIKAVARKEFITAYKGGAWPKLLETLGECVSWQSLERWKLKIRDGSAFSLADNRGLHNQGKTEITEEQYEILIRAALHPNKPHVAEVVRTAKKVFKAQGITCDLADKTLRRAVLKFRETNYGEWVYTREGKKAWNDKCAFYIERDYDRIEVGDIVVADGHKLNFETVNPWTGQASRMEMVLWYDMKSNFPLGWEILPTEDIRCIASAFGRSVLRLGKKPKVAYLDNGRAFKSAYFNGVDFTQSGLGGLFHELGIHTIFAWPYHGQSKPVERFFKTFGELERYVPSYVGTDIGSK